MIEFVNVSKIYPGLVALNNINFEIDEGEFVFLTGASGSGKTTIIKLIIKEEEPTEGHIYFYDTDISKLKGPKITQLRREIGVVFQDFKLLQNKNLYENIAFTLEVAGKKNKDIEETVPYVLNLVGLDKRAEAFPDEISGGEQQKISIARAIANNPKLLIADEPTGNLDKKSSWEIINLLNKINQWGTTVIMATHGTDFIEKLDKRIIHLENGQVVSDNKSNIFEKPIIKIKPQKTDTKMDIKNEQKIKEKPEDSIKVNLKDAKKVSPKLKSDISTQKETKKSTDINEKEFDISFSIKQFQPRNKNSKKRTGKDVVDLYKLNLPIKIEEILIKENINTLKKLKKLNSSDLVNISSLNDKQIKVITNKLEKYQK